MVPNTRMANEEIDSALEDRIVGWDVSGGGECVKKVI